MDTNPHPTQPRSSTSQPGDLHGANRFALCDLGAAGMAASGQACDTSSMQGSDPIGITLGDPLNFRQGPGLNYAIVTTLDYCTSAKLTVRTTDEAFSRQRLRRRTGHDHPDLPNADHLGRRQQSWIWEHVADHLVWECGPGWLDHLLPVLSVP